MSGQGQQVLKEALDLPPTERAELIERLFRSLDLPASQAMDPLWAEECEQRIDAYEAGQIRAATAQQVFEAIDRRQSR